MASTPVKAFVILIFFAIIGVTTGTAISPLDVLIVNDGHTLKTQSVLPADHFLSRYKQALEPIENVNITVRNVSATGLGPSTETMANHDVVIWYTLQDHSGNPNCPDSSSDACTTLYGDPLNPKSGGGDIENITTYLSEKNGRLFLTGHRFDHSFRGTDFYEDWLGAFHTSDTSFAYVECLSSSCTEITDTDMSSVLVGEDNDPVTRDSFFQAELNTTIEPLGERDIFTGYCFDEILGRNYCHDAGNPLVTDDSFQWDHDTVGNHYGISTDGDTSDAEEYAHSLVHVNTTNRKSVYAGFGFEALIGEQNRKHLMNWTINYLAGPRADETTVRDASNTDYPHYTNGIVNISAICKNRQIQVGTGVSTAQMFVQNDSGGIPENPRAQTEGDGYIMDATDGGYGASTEQVNYTGYNASDRLDNTNAEGANHSFAVHCRDDDGAQYWGQFEKDWVVVDTVAPQTPDSVSFSSEYTNEAVTPITVDYGIFAQGVRADLVRFSCDQNSWGSWKTYDPSPAPGSGGAPSSKQFDLNLTDSNLGCSSGDGPRTVYVQARDYANNTAASIVSDSVTLDRVTPTFQGLLPANDSFIQNVTNVTVNATDDGAGIVDNSGSLKNEFDNGSVNQSFSVNESFDPGYTEEGDQSLTAWIRDRAANVLRLFFSFVVDVNPPTLDVVTPSNGSVIAVDTNITLNASDDRSFSHLVVYNGSENQTFDAGDVSFDPGWTTEKQHNVTMWLNDSASHVLQTRLTYTIDDTPPSFTGVNPANDSFILNTTDITINVSDAVAGLATTVFYNGSFNQSFTDGEAFDPGWTTEGKHDLTLYANDSLGNRNSSTFVFTVDEIPPSSATNHTWSGWRSTNKTVSVNATDNFRLSGVQYCVYDKGAAPCTPQTFVPENASVTIGCVQGDTCVQFLRFRANDSAGHVESVNTSQNVSIDKEAPGVQIQQPITGSTTGGVVDLETGITDAGAGGIDANYSIVNETNMSDIKQSGDLNLSNNWDATWNSSDITVGMFVFNVTAVDGLGNLRKKNVTFSVDNARPSVSITEPFEEYVNGSFSFVSTARRPGGQISNHSYKMFRGADENKSHSVTTTADWNQGTFNGTTVDRDDNVGVLGIGYRNGTKNAGLEEGLVGYWRLDRTSGSIRDYSGHGNDGTNNGSTRGVTGVFATDAFEFDGSDDGVNVSHDASFDVENLTVSAWVNMDSLNTPGHGSWIVSHGDDAPAEDETGFEFYYEDGTGWEAFWAGTSQSSGSLTATRSVQTGRWYHVVFTFDGGNASIYENGRLVGTNASDIDAIQYPRDCILRIGKFSNCLGNESFSNPLDGTIDEVRVYNRSLSPNEIRKLYFNTTADKYFEGNYTSPLIDLTGSVSWNTLTVNATSSSTIDDFEDGDLSEWTGGSGATIQETIVQDGSGALRYKAGSSAMTSQSGLPHYPSAGDEWELWTRWNASSPGRVYVKFYDDGGTEWYGLLLEGGTDMELRTDEGSTIITSMGLSSTNADTWYRINVDWDANGDFNISMFDSGGNLVNFMDGTDTTHSSGGLEIDDVDMTAGTSYFFDEWSLNGVEADAVFQSIDSSGSMVDEQVINLSSGRQNYSLNVVDSEDARWVINGTSDSPSRTWEVSDVTTYYTGKQEVVNQSTETDISTGQHNFSRTIDPETWSDGNYTINVTTGGSSGQTARFDTWFFLDRVPPVSTVSSPSNGTWQTGTVTFEYTALDRVANQTCTWRYRDDNGVWEAFTAACGSNSFTFDTENCDTEPDADCEVQIRATDKAGNPNKTAIRLKVDNTPPIVSFNAPAAGSWQNGDFTVNRSDVEDAAPFTSCGWRNASMSSFINSGNSSCGSDFTVDVSQYCQNQGENTCTILLRAINTPGLSATTSRKFSIDTGRPTIKTVTPGNNSFVTDDDNITVTFSDAVSGVKFAQRNNGTHNVSISSGASFDPGWTTDGNRTLTLTLNDSANNVVQKRYTFRVDVAPPNATDTRFNVSADPAFNETRVYRDDPIQLQINISENVRMSTVTATLNTSRNALPGENVSLSARNGVLTDDVWTVNVTDTGAVGTYNFTRLYLSDVAGHTNMTVNTPAFRVVNHSVSTTFGGDNESDAGRTELLNMTVNLNRTLQSPMTQLFVPPSDTVHERPPQYTNTTAYQCRVVAGNGSCSLQARGSNITTLNITGSDTVRTVRITADVTAGTPAADETVDWVSSVGRNTQRAKSVIRAPRLNVSAVYCDDGKDCNVTQQQVFNLTVTVANEQDTDHTGGANEVVVNVSGTGAGVKNKTLVGDLASNTSTNISFLLIVQKAGTFSLDLVARDNATRQYTDSQTRVVDVSDALFPNTTDVNLETPFVNLDQVATFEVTARDNVGVEPVLVTVVHPSTGATNRSMTLTAGNTRRGRWSLTYGDTGVTGDYNLSALYVNDSADNLNVTRLDQQFTVVNLETNASVNTTTINVTAPLRITADVTGNVSTVSSFITNVSKPRGVVEQVTLSPVGGSFAATYTNASRSGPYTVNATVTAGSKAWNDSQTFSVPFGDPAVEPLDGNGTHLVLPPSSAAFNVSWAVKPVKGDLRNATATLNITNTTVIDTADGISTRTIGNVTYEAGAAFVDFNLSVVQNGTTTMTLDVNTSKGGTTRANSSVTVTIDASNPNITGVGETPSVVNKQQAVDIRVNVSDRSVLQNVSLVVNHPENGSNATEAMTVMDRKDRGQYRHVFTNTNETGHYTYKVKTWDLAGNQDTFLATSFNVTEEYTVTATPNHDTYKKGETGEFDVSVADASGDSVDDFNLTLVLGKDGTNVTLLPANDTDESSYRFSELDPPVSGGSTTATYTLYANVSEDGNTGVDTTTFTVDRQLYVEFISPTQGDDVTPGEDFNLTVNLTDARGNKVTEAVSFTKCNTCPGDFEFLEHQGSGQYQGTLTAPSDSDSALIEVFADDGLGNTEDTPPNNNPPRITVDVTTASNDSSEESSGDSGGGGGGGGFGSLPSFSVDVLSPSPNLPTGTQQVNFSVSTGEAATCRYDVSDSSFNASALFDVTSGLTHYSMLPVETGTTYNYHVYCRNADGTVEETVHAFSIRQQEFSTYDIRLSNTTVSVPQGDQGSTQFSVFNNGTEQLRIGLGATSPCCEVTLADSLGQAIEELVLTPETGRVVETQVRAPLNVSTGQYNVLLRFVRENRTRERSFTVVVEEGRYVERLRVLSEEVSALQGRVEQYRNSGMNVSALKDSLERVNETIIAASAAIEQDKPEKLQQQVEDGEKRAEELRAAVDDKFVEWFIRTYWQELLLAFITGYVTLFIIVMVAVPYYRLREESREVKESLRDAMHARENAEKQYFRREIDREVFMDIQTERQDEILELRGRRDDLEEEMDSFVWEQLTLSNFLGLPTHLVSGARKVGHSLQKVSAAAADAAVEQIEEDIDDMEDQLTAMKQYRQRLERKHEEGEIEEKRFKRLMRHYRQRKKRLMDELEEIQEELD